LTATDQTSKKRKVADYINKALQLEKEEKNLDAINFYEDALEVLPDYNTSKIQVY
jgi:hypothetical protein